MLNFALKAVLRLGAVITLTLPLFCHAEDACDYGSGADKGLVFFSGTMPVGNEKPPILGTPLAFRYLYNHAGGTRLTQQAAWLTPAGLLHPAASEFPDAGFGRMFVLRLKAGDYEFQEWSFRGYGWQGEVTPRGIGPLGFKVQAHRAVYLGNFDAILFKGTNSRGQPVVEPWMTIRDQRTRDLTAFQARCPKLDPTQVDIQVLDPAPWSKNGQAY